MTKMPIVTQHGFLWQGGVVRLHCSASSPLVYSGCLDGVVRVWDVRSGECVQQWHGHSDHILDITVARYVLSSPLSLLLE